MEDLRERGALLGTKNDRPRQTDVERELSAQIAVEKTVYTQAVVMIIPRLCNQICKETQLILGRVPCSKISSETRQREGWNAHSR